MCPESPLLRLDVTSRSIDEAVAFYERVYDSDDIHIDAANSAAFSYRYRAVGDDDVTVGGSAVDGHRWGTIGEGRQYVLAWTPGSGIVLDTASDDPIVVRPNVPVMYPTGRSFGFDAQPGAQHLIRFDADFLEAVAAANSDSLPAQLVFARDTTQANHAALQAVIRGAAPRLLDPTTTSAERKRLNLLVAESVLAAFGAAPDRRSDIGSRTVRRAQEYLVAHAADHVSIGATAAALNVSVRSLQASFERHVGLSPMMFLRHTRLHRVRARLLALHPGTTTVAEQASRYGFTHMGRFAAYYAERFGESPSETLRRRRLI
jgi:AraC-like DNA-binding protein